MKYIALEKKEFLDDLNGMQPGNMIRLEDSDYCSLVIECISIRNKWELRFTYHLPNGYPFQCRATRNDADEVWKALRYIIRMDDVIVTHIYD